jgi:crossover junction endodeoxyribonuclease RuvC
MTGAPVVLGIDPGLSGALAALDPAGRVVAVLDMPTLETGNGRRTVNVVALRTALYSLLPIRACWIENVSAMPTDSRVAAFAFGRSVGALEAACLLSGVPVQRVTPQVWKRDAGLPTGVPKAASVEAALRLLPGSAPYLTRVKDHGRADALLIARYGLSLSAV